MHQNLGDLDRVVGEWSDAAAKSAPVADQPG
jgi:hypothetical protein